MGWAQRQKLGDPVAKAREIINSPEFQPGPWLKKVLVNQYQVTEARSKHINWGVRQNAASIEAQRGDSNPEDEGYMRAKTRAEEKLSTFLRTLKAA